MKNGNNSLQVYAIGGLGADERVFDGFDIVNILRPVKWITPHGNESFNAYAHQITEQIDYEKPFILIGVSFGGILAQEIASVVKPELLVLISSISERKDIPFLLRITQRLGVLSALPKVLFRPPLPLLRFLFSLKNEREVSLLKAIMKDTDTRFIKWALLQMASYHPQKLDNTVVIHGAKDLLIPTPAKVDLLLEGGHFAVIQEAETISAYLNEKLAELNEA